TVIEGAEVTGVDQDAQGVTVTASEDGSQRELRGQYLIAADGGHSRVRQLLGIQHEGRGAFSNSITIYFTADLSPWIAGHARSFQDKRIFIIGDGAHLMPPNGGFGGNTGVHDAHNLAWKLALVIEGHASEHLLSTYASERKPVAQLTVEQAFSRYVARTAPWL